MWCVTLRVGWVPKYALSIFLIILLIPCAASSAEVLLVRSSSILQIGDQNRSYTVRLACLEIDPTNELEAKNFLKLKLPRGKKVNFRPQGSTDGLLLARVKVLGMDKDLSQELIDGGLGSSLCDPLT